MQSRLNAERWKLKRGRRQTRKLRLRKLMMMLTSRKMLTKTTMISQAKTQKSPLLSSVKLRNNKRLPQQQLLQLMTRMMTNMPMMLKMIRKMNLEICNKLLPMPKMMTNKIKSNSK